jgi:hypothetical protein
MSDDTDLGRADRLQLEQLARVMFEAGGDPNAFVDMSGARCQAEQVLPD